LNRLVIFVRAPVTGQVKSRLAAVLGAEEACAAYRTMVGELVSNLSSLRGVELRFTPAGAEALVSDWLEAGWTTAPQCEGDLGSRMLDAFRDAFAFGATRVALIGSDAPQVTVEDVQTAWAELGNADVVLGPAVDGGYWLIGMRTIQPSLFQTISWGTATVLSDTTQRARAAGLSVSLLRSLADIDTAEDWAAYMKNDPLSTPTKNQGGT
jgi:rSAM/selenodomain-associated transferase 1